MRTQPADTDLKIEKVLIALLREAKASQKFAQVRSLSAITINLSRRAIFQKNPGLSDLKKKILLVHHFY